MRYNIKENMWEVIQASSEKHQGPSARYGHSLVAYDVRSNVVSYISLLLPCIINCFCWLSYSNCKWIFWVKGSAELFLGVSGMCVVRLFLFLPFIAFIIVIHKQLLCNCTNLGSCVFCAPLDQHIGRHIDRQSTDVLVDISAECRPTCRSTYRSSVGQYVNQDVSLDILAYISVEHRWICRLTLDWYVGRYVDQEWLSDCWLTCRSIGYRYSADSSLLLAYWWL